MLLLRHCGNIMRCSGLMTALLAGWLADEEVFFHSTAAAGIQAAQLYACFPRDVFASIRETVYSGIQDDVSGGTLGE